MYQKIILAYDGSLESQQALLNCKDLSQWEHAAIHPLGGSAEAYATYLRSELARWAAVVVDSGAKAE